MKVNFRKAEIFLLIFREADYHSAAGRSSFTRSVTIIRAQRDYHSAEGGLINTPYPLFNSRNIRRRNRELINSRGDQELGQILIGCHFADAGAMGCEFNTVDYMHLTKKGHATLAEHLAKLVPELVK